MRNVLAVVMVLAMGVVSCDEDVSPRGQDEMSLAFVVEETLTLPDSAAYVQVIGSGRIDLVGFYTGCSYTMQGRLLGPEVPSIVVDVEINRCPVICIRNVHSRYRGTITGVPPGEHRVLLEHVVRDCHSGELTHVATVLDTVVTVPS